ncbi:MAG TPA: hypothetical protein VF695_02665 [Sphingomonas sp.]|jgi:hypothetical protein
MSGAQTSLRESIERCYASFAAIERPGRLETSPLRDAGDILHTLTSAPLRALTGEQIGPYSGWAMTTVGNERDYRHFLPRILELAVDDPVWLGAEPAIIAHKLCMASWRDWPVKQRSAVLSFFQAAFDASLGAEAGADPKPDEWLCGLVLLGEPPLPIINRWRASGQPDAVLQMELFVDRERKNLDRRGAVRGSFWTHVQEEDRREVAELLLSAETTSYLEASAVRRFEG